MDRNPFHPTVDDLPPSLPIFPLPGALVLPDTELPLNVFEPRYVAMILDALKGHRLIGMIQPRNEDGQDAPSGPVWTMPDPAAASDPQSDPPVYSVGAAGRITSFSETADGRLLINLYGVSRFRIREHLPNVRGYRRVSVNWSEFASDLEPPQVNQIDRSQLSGLLRAYFEQQGLKADWDTIEKTDLPLLVNTLTMVCPFPANEKQALLEAATVDDRAQMMQTLMEMALCGDGQDDSPAH